MKLLRAGAICVWAGTFKSSKMDAKQQTIAADAALFNKTPVPISKSPGSSPSVRTMTQTVIVSLAETVTHDITYGESIFPFQIAAQRTFYENVSSCISCGN